MSYSDFTSIAQLAPFGITSITTVNSVIPFTPVEPSQFLQDALTRFIPIATAINTEKARSEYLIAPILSELMATNSQISLFSGRSFNVDPARGLNGFCDFILTQNPDRLTIKSPVAVIVEAKNENINDGIAQCIAEMVAARIVNQLEPHLLDHSIYGCVTTGQVWRFLVLTTAGEVQMDLRDRYLTPIDELLGVLIAMVTR